MLLPTKCVEYGKVLVLLESPFLKIGTTCLLFCLDPSNSKRFPVSYSCTGVPPREPGSSPVGGISFTFVYGGSFRSGTEVARD